MKFEKEECMTQTKLDFTNEFKPIWQKFKWFLVTLLLIWLSFCLSIVLGWGLGNSLFKYLFILVAFGSAMGWFYFGSVLKCPNCKQPFVFWWYSDFSPYIRIFLTGECFNCGAILKKKWMPQEGVKKLGKILVVIVILILLIGITAAFIKGGIEIKYEHIDIPESECK